MHDPPQVSRLRRLLIGEERAYSKTTPEDSDKIRTIVIVSRLAAFFLTLVAIARWSHFSYASLLLPLVACLLLINQAWVLKTGNIRVARHLFLSLSLVIVICGLLHRGGNLSTPVGFTGVLMPWLAFRVCGSRIGLVWSAFTMGLMGCIGLLEIRGLLPPDSVPTGQQSLHALQGFLAICFIWVTTGFVTQRQHAQDMEQLEKNRRALRESKQQQIRLQMQQNLNQLEQMASVGRLAAGTAGGGAGTPVLADPDHHAAGLLVAPSGGNEWCARGPADHPGPRKFSSLPASLPPLPLALAPPHAAP